MKRFLALCAVLCFLFLTACGAEKSDPNVYNVEYNGKVYSVNQIERTISVDGYTCEFSVTGSGNSTDFKVTYPNGSTYWMRWSNSSGHGGYGGDYDASRYVSGDTLWNVLEQEHPGAKQTSNHAGLGILLLIFGVLEAASPRTFWWLSHGWRFKDAEPSEAALALGRVGGIIMVLAGIICFFV